MADVILLEELKQWLNSKKRFVLIDVRESNELQHGMIPTAHHVSLGQLSAALDLSANEFEKQFKFPKPSKSDNAVFYCRTGSRSAVAARIASSKGFTAFNFHGSVFEWSKSDPAVRFYGPAPMGR
ncbi:MAG: rhodanese-like domain-containing protein [Candidatus Diapherotrites archaeon]|nr:rhodanese-like domain-containing protein [Candidatus Diapherotrites archaeon]